MLESLQNILAQALYHPDPKARLEELTGSAELTEEERGYLAGVQTRGLKLTHLLLMNLRFERILKGLPAAVRWFELDPEGFVQVFRKYNAAVLPTELFASGEGAAFRRFLQDLYPHELAKLKNNARS